MWWLIVGAAIDDDAVALNDKQLAQATSGRSHEPLVSLFLTMKDTCA